MDYPNFTNAQNAYPMAGGSVQTPPEVSTPVRDRISGLESWLSDCHNGLDMLEKRLDTILTPVPPQPATTNSGVKNGPPSSHVRGRLELLQEGFGHLIARMNALHSRIEL